MKRQSILIWLVVMTASTSVYSSDWQLDWVDGDYIPTSWNWSIYPFHFPPSPHPPGTVPFSGPTGVFSNDCFARGNLGGTPTITIDPNHKTIELWFQPPAPTMCLMYYDPVCGLNGWFGPLSEGDWLFYSNQIPSPYGPFYINFNVDDPPILTILNPNGNEYLFVGSIYTIRWEDSRSERYCGGSYLLNYSIDNGNNWIPIDSNPISNTCTYDWLVPSISSNQCLVRITDAGYPYISDTSNDSFCIFHCQGAVLGDWNGDCYVDFDDFSIIAAGWNVPGGMDMNDLATLGQYWLDCANPLDPSCSFGEAMPEYPIDGALIKGDIVAGNISTSLIFVPGPTAVEHKGYFNEDYNKVASRHPDANLGPPPYGQWEGYEYTFWVGNPGVPPAYETLVRGTTYYWTVDETDAQGNTFAGDIWEFTILGFYAFAPDPPNEAAFVGTDVLLSWQPGYGVDYHDIYMGTSWEDVNNAVYDPFNPPPEFLATTTEPNIVVTSLAINTIYYWRVDEIDGSRLPPWPWIWAIYKGPVWCFTTISGSAEPDFPADGTVIPGEVVQYPDHDYISTSLIFVPGPTAVEHAGYFNEDYSKVESRHQDANLGPPPYAEWEGYEYTFWVGNPGVPPITDSLVRGTKYYWTVDETDALGNTFTGDIWEFTIQDFYASEPNPPNEAAFVETDVLLSWQPGYGAWERDIYLGTSWEDVNNAVYNDFNPPPEFVATTTEPNIVVTSLAINTIYYWRVDEIDGSRLPPLPWIWALYKGPVWCFTTTPCTLTPGQANNPNPPDGAGVADVDADLSWTAGNCAESHDVYFGTSNPPSFIANQIATTFDPGTMTIGAKYYWRIDEVNSSDKTTGTVWSFTIMTPPP